MLSRFHQAQESKNAGYATALAEIRAGQKRSHWIWYIFPQIQGLGKSAQAEEYGLRDLEEACDYLHDPVLRARYQEITTVVYDQLEEGIPLNTLMGSSIDAQKLVSSLTLFHAAASKCDLQETERELVRLSDHILQIAALQDYPACELTLKKIYRG